MVPYSIFAFLPLVTAALSVSTISDPTTETEITLVPTATSTVLFVPEVTSTLPVTTATESPKVSKPMKLVLPDIIVAKDGSGDFTKIQEAIDSVPKKNTERKVIYIKEGRYFEKLTIKPSFLTFVGDSNGKTGIEYNDNTNKTGGTLTSTTVMAKGSDLQFYNLTFINSAPWPTQQGGQAVAFAANGGRTYVERCNFFSWQDTLYAHRNTQYYKNCYIRGQVDFIFGMGRAVFENPIIFATGKPSSPGGKVRAYITADGSSDPEYKTGGILIRNSNVRATAGVEVLLGRTWGSHAHVLFAGGVLPVEAAGTGWISMGSVDRTNTSRVGEFGTHGPGAIQDGRADFAYQYESVPSNEEWFKDVETDMDWLNPEPFMIYTIVAEQLTGSGSPLFGAASSAGSFLGLLMVLF